MTVDNEIIMKMEDLSKTFLTTSGIIRRNKRVVVALDKVTLDIKKAEILGLIGESGSGKSTLGLAALKLLDIDGGKLLYRGNNIYDLNKKDTMNFREKTQMIFQDPYGSLNPVLSVYNTISTPYKVFHKNANERDVIERVLHVLEIVGLSPSHQYLAKFPNQLSGGQRQRVGIARAIITSPEFLVADEPVSMLDVSLRADILNILLNLRKELSTSILFISHDIAVTQYVSDRIAVMHLGQIVEIAESTELLNKPLHPYTQTLINSIPIPDPEKKWDSTEPKVLAGEYNNEGKNECSFARKCPFVMDKCRVSRPPLIEKGKDHYVACYLYE
ncbi:MAG: oligopeptide/dipeptide ABC transporter ATP-binding protein [Thermoplasmata archaeon]